MTLKELLKLNQSDEKGILDLGELDLTALPPLEKKECRKSAGLYCRLCKCFLPAKACIEDMHCPQGKW